MSGSYRPLDAKDVLDLYFIENRSRMLDIAAFLDRIERHEGAAAAQADFRYQAFMNLIDLLKVPGGNRAKAIQLALSDPTSEPLESALGMRAYGAWKGEQP